MQDLAKVLAKMEPHLAHSPNTDECWCGGKGGRGVRFYPPFGQYTEAQEVFDEFCSCAAGRVAAERKQHVHEEFTSAEGDRYARLRWDRSGIPQRFREYHIARSPLAAIYPALIKRLDGGTVRDREEGDWDDFFGSWYFYGGYGVGKTGLAVCHAKEINKALSPGDTLVFAPLPHVFTALRSTYNRHGEDQPTEAQILGKYINATFLVLDDLGAEHVSGSGWLEDRLYQIIGTRHDEERQTVFTSNLSLEHLARRVGERITWRILEMCGPGRVVLLDSPNLRDVIS